MKPSPAGRRIHRAREVIIDDRWTSSQPDAVGSSHEPVETVGRTVAADTTAETDITQDERDGGTLSLSVILPAVSSTPPPRVDCRNDMEDARHTRSMSSQAIPTSKKFDYQRKPRRRLHPLQEQRSEIDVWPAPRPGEQRHEGDGFGTTTSAAPQLLVDIIDEVQHKLQKLALAFPDVSKAHSNVVPSASELDLVGQPTASVGGRAPSRVDGALQSSLVHAASASPHAPSRGSLIKAVDLDDNAVAATQHDRVVAPTAAVPTHRGALDAPQPSFVLSMDGSTPGRATRGAGRALTNNASSAPSMQQKPKSKSSVEVRAEARSLLGHQPTSTGVARQNAKVHLVSVVGGAPLRGLVDAHEQKLTRKRSVLNTMKRSAEDIYRTQRVAIFEGAGIDFSNHFSTYRSLLLWIFREFRDYEAYCHKHVVSPDMRRMFEADLRAEMQDDFADERARLNFELTELRRNFEELSAKYQQSRLISSTSERRLAEKDALIAAHEAEIAENAEGRAALLARMHRMEKELWAQRDAREGPEAIINGLQKEVKSLEERLTFANKAVEESNMDKAVLKVRLERLEDLLKERKLRQAQTVPKSELLIYKKAQIDILELNANLEAKLLKMRGAYRSLTDDVQRLKAGQPGTPRPPWHLADDIFPAASTTAQRVHLAMREYRTMMQNNQLLLKENEELKQIVAMMPRGDDGLRPEYVLLQMQTKFFYKLGFDASVPAYLKGNGKAMNLRLSMDQTAGACRQLLLHRDTVRPSSSSPESVFESFAVKHAPPNVPSQDFAYSLYYAMRWFAFDPFIGLMRRFLCEEIDDTVIAHLEKVIVGCKLFIQSAADELNLGGTAPPSAVMSGGAEERPTEGIRRKSLMNLTSAAEAEAAAKKVLGPQGTTFAAQVLTVEEPRLLYKAEILPLIADYFCNKTEEQLKALVGKISLDYSGIQVDSRALFRFVGTKRRFTAFVEEIIRQAIVENEELVLDYILCVQSITNSSGHVTPNDVAKAIWRLDPLLPGACMDEMLADLFEVSVEEIRPRIVEGSYFRTPGVDGERFYEENPDDPLIAEERQIADRIRRRILQRFCPKADAELERLRMDKEAERAKERAELDLM